MKSTSFYIVLLPTILLTSAYQMGAPNFECGPHGRFEYCINGNPGCIVGCHCHPGYYFDTESKICESNDKLRLNYRREYNDLAPTPTPLTTTKLIPTPTKSNIIDRNVEAIAKDADDLGDWLYNQFFKTIENQVINKTSEEKTPSRRSGSEPPKTETSTSCPELSIQRRSGRKRSKKTSKKKKRHSKKGGLRKKLLRISEDDSLFDSSSASSDSSASSSSASSETDSSSTDTDESTSKERSRDHGHRKILMINKKPHPPLPSFIFMPNMETPYFPPLGLPPPPIMPMYPMIPVPPMMPSISIIQSTPAAAETQATTAHSEATTAASTAATTEAPKAATTEATAPAETDPPETPEPEAAEPGGERSGFTGRKYRKGNAREKFMRKFREKMKRRHELPHPINYFPDEVDDPVLGRINLPEAFPESFMFDEPQEPDEGPPGQDVNFKYLSQLIHKMNKSDAKQSPHKPGAKKMPNPRNFKPSHAKHTKPKDIPRRRLGDTDDPTPTPMIIEKDDYADLGRQIAALVRKIDTKGEHQINLDYEKSVSGNIPPTVVFNDNGMSSRSYWERFARSPFKFTFDTEQYSYLDSSEKLLSLEDQVSNTATTKRSLTLQQVENLINIIETVKTVHDNPVQGNIEQPKERTKAPYSPPKNLSLLSEFDGLNKRHIPKYNLQSEKENVTNTLYKAHIDIDYKKSQPMQFNITYHENILPTTKTNLISDNFAIKPDKLRSDKIMPDKLKHINNNIPQRFKMPLSRLLQHAAMQQSYAAIPTRNKQNLKPIYLPQNQRPYNIIRYKNWSPTNGIYHYENIVSAPNVPSGPLNKPSSYFHHQLNHFDYFD